MTLAASRFLSDVLQLFYGPIVLNAKGSLRLQGSRGTGTISMDGFVRGKWTS